MAMSYWLMVIGVVEVVGVGNNRGVVLGFCGPGQEFRTEIVQLPLVLADEAS